MNDTISRQALCEYALNQKNKSVTPNDIMRFPSVQPETHEERTETHACDCISRKEAIEAFDNLEWFHQNANKDMVSGANPEHHQAWYKEQDVYKALERVPSAQPEIIRCKDCKHHGTNGYRLNCAVFCCTMPDDGFCSCGERRTDE